MGDLEKKICEITKNKFEKILEMDELKRRLIANLQSYLRERQDFIASIPTMDPIWTAPFDIIGNVFEPILGNLDSKDKCPNLFLLFDNITRSENIRAGAIQFEIKVFSQKGSISYISNFYIQDGDVFYKFDKSESMDKDYKAAIYLGTLGCHAFYSIIENFLRNTARHSKREQLEKVIKYSEDIKNKKQLDGNSKPLKLRIDFHYNDHTYQDDYILVKIYDNMEGWEKEKDRGIWVVKEKDEKGKEKLKLVMLEENVKEDDAKEQLKEYIDTSNLKSNGEKNQKTEKELNSIIFNRRLNPECDEGKIIDEIGKIKEGAWGMKEMRICASFLRGLKIENYETLQETPVIKPFIQPNKDNRTGNLGFEFYIPKVKDLLIISKDMDKNINKDELKNQGIYIEKDTNKIIELQNQGTFTHEFVVIDIDKNENVNFIKHNILKLPYKLFYLSSNGDVSDEIKNVDERADKRVIKKDNFKKWFNTTDKFTINNIEFEVNDSKEGVLKSHERVILEIRKKWIEYLINDKNLPRVGFYPFTLLRQWNSNALIFCEKSKAEGKNLSLPFLENIKGNILLLHKLDRYDEIMNSCSPLCILPFAHAHFSAIREIKIKLQKSNISNFDILNSYLNALELGLTNVIIIDERMYDEAKKVRTLYDKKVRFALFWFLQNIIICNLEKRGNQFILKILKMDLQNFFEKEILIGNGESDLLSVLPTNFKNKVHFLVIHQTIISPKIGGKGEFEKFVGLLPQNYKPWYIIITSGRGHPPKDEISEIKQTKFFDFSNLRNSMIDKSDKFLLTKNLSGLKEKEK